MKNRHVNLYSVLCPLTTEHHYVLRHLQAQGAKDIYLFTMWTEKCHVITNVTSNFWFPVTSEMTRYGVDTSRESIKNYSNHNIQSTTQRYASDYLFSNIYGIYNGILRQFYWVSFSFFYIRSLHKQLSELMLIQLITRPQRVWLFTSHHDGLLDR